MNLRDCLVRGGIVDSAKVCALRPATQLFFRNLFHVCDGAARFEADADRLRTMLYGRVLSRVSKGDVTRWMTECHQADLIKLYTRDGRGYGKVLNYGQRDSKRKVLYPGEEEEGLFATAAPDGGSFFAPKPGNGIEGKSPHSPPPAGGAETSSTGAKAAKPARFRRAERLDTLNEERERLEEEMRAILRPGGCAYNIEPTDPAKRERLQNLREGHAELLKHIERRRAELSREDAA